MSSSGKDGKTYQMEMKKGEQGYAINSGHNDYIFASQNKARKLKYICRLFAKELVIKNFSGFPVDMMLQRIVELTLYTEENLR